VYIPSVYVGERLLCKGGVSNGLGPTNCGAALQISRVRVADDDFSSITNVK